MAARKLRSTAKAARPTTVAAYLASLTPEKRTVIAEARAFVHRHIPKGYAEFMNWGVINWGIPLDEFSDTYNGQPLCYVGLGAKKSYNSLYLMSVYGSREHEKRLRDGFVESGKKLDMGKSCIHFQRADDLPLDVIGELIASMPVAKWIAIFEASRRTSKSRGNV